MRQLAIAFLALPLLGCLPESSRHAPTTWNPADWRVQAFSDPPVSCSCPNARRYYLVNNTTTDRTANVTQVENHIFDNSATEVEKVLSVVGKGRQFLSCSPKRTQNECDTQVTWRIDGRLYTGETSLKVDAKVSKKKGAKLVAAAPPPNCRAECLGPTPGPSCLLADNSANGSNTPEHKLLTAIGEVGATGVVSRSSLLSAWGRSEADEPCGRGEVRTIKGVFTNTGGRCEFAGAYGGAGTGVVITLPDEVVGKYARTGSNFSIAFPKADVAPLLKFSNPFFETQFGGPIRQIEQTDSHFLVTTPTGCLGLKL